MGLRISKLSLRSRLFIEGIGFGLLLLCLLGLRELLQCLNSSQDLKTYGFFGFVGLSFSKDHKAVMAFSIIGAIFYCLLILLALYFAVGRIMFWLQYLKMKEAEENIKRTEAANRAALERVLPYIEELDRANVELGGQALATGTMTYDYIIQLIGNIGENID